MPSLLPNHAGLAAFTSAAVFASFAHAAGPAYLVRDIDPTVVEEPRYPSLGIMRRAGDRLFVAGFETGFESALHSIDTSGDLGVVKRGVAATPNSVLHAEVNGVLFFRASGGISIKSLWKSDGTAPGTARLKSFGSADESGAVLQNFVSVGDVLYFAAEDPEHGVELWKSDGTVEGTVLVKDLLPGPFDGFPFNLTDVNGTLFFSGRDGGALGQVGRGNKLWRNDGTEQGTVAVKDVAPDGFATERYDNFTAFGDRLYFTVGDGFAGDELWMSDGSPGGTAMVKDIRPGAADSAPSSLRVIGDVLYFAADDGIHGKELWRSDGTPEGTRLLCDVRPGSEGSNPTGFIAVAGTIFFVTHEPGVRNELWKTDGACAGTTRIGNVEPDVFDPLGEHPVAFMTASGDTLFLVAGGPMGSDLGIWRSDGTDQGTELVRIIPPYVGGKPIIRGLTEFDGFLYFHAERIDYGSDLWRSDGTTAGTVVIAGGSVPVPRGSDPFDLTDVAGTLLFGAKPESFTPYLWRSDGTADGTRQMGEAVRTHGDIIEIDGTAYSPASGQGLATELWKSEAPYGQLTLVKEINASMCGIPLGPIGSNPRDFAQFNGVLYFSAGTGAFRHPIGLPPPGCLTDRELWRSDGAATGTWKVAEINNAPDVVVTAFVDGGIGRINLGSAGPAGLTVSRGSLYFSAYDAEYDRELWKSDGTVAGTIRVRNISDSTSSSPEHLFDFGGLLLFSADDGIVGRELWASNGESSGTTLLADIHPSAGSDPLGFTELDGVVFFAADHADYGRELWATAGTASSTRLVKDMNAGAEGAEPEDFLQGVGVLYFTADDGIHGRELWLSDGTPEGTHIVLDIFPGSEGSDPNGLVRVGPYGAIAFSAADGVLGTELWASDGTALGTMLVQDINPGPASSNCRWLTVSGDRLYFSAVHPIAGRELWAAPLSAFEVSDSVKPSRWQRYR